MDTKKTQLPQLHGSESSEQFYPNPYGAVDKAITPQVAALPIEAPCALPVFYRTYSREAAEGGRRETFQETCDRVVSGLAAIPGIALTQDELDLLRDQLENLKTTCSGRWFWVGGSEWIKNPKNSAGAFNCVSLHVDKMSVFSDTMSLLMQGCGVGGVVTQENLEKLPKIECEIDLRLSGNIGEAHIRGKYADTVVEGEWRDINITVGDSRKGWADAFSTILNAATGWNGQSGEQVKVCLYLGHVRPAGEKLKGFGGVSNPARLEQFFRNVVDILNGCHQRDGKLNALEAELLRCEAASCVVAGNIRRSALIGQGSSDDTIFQNAKSGLWTETDGKWQIDPAKASLVCVNHTRIFTHVPTEEECIEAVRHQVETGEGAIQWAGETIARANADVLDTERTKTHFLYVYKTMGPNHATIYLRQLANISNAEAEERMSRIGLNPCAEVVAGNFVCNLSEVHLNRINPYDTQAQIKAIKAAALWCASMLHFDFPDYPDLQTSKNRDPIVGVGLTGIFDFFVVKHGIDYLHWWQSGRPDTTEGRFYKRDEASRLNLWQEIAKAEVWAYCDRVGMKRPSRVTCVKPSGTLSLLSNASPGWHPPKAVYYIRRITFRRDDPVALACIDYGYNVIPSANCKDEHGNMLDDPYDPRVTEWMIEIPVAVPWADIPGAEGIKPEKFSAIAQLDFWLTIQQNWTGHNTSATIEVRQDEIEAVGKRIHEMIANDEGYVSVAILRRFDEGATFPRMPFEPISREEYEAQSCAVSLLGCGDFEIALRKHDRTFYGDAPAPCDSEKCELR